MNAPLNANITLEIARERFYAIVRDACDEYTVPADACDEVKRQLAGEPMVARAMKDWLFHRAVLESVHNRRHERLSQVKGNGGRVIPETHRGAEAIEATAATRMQSLLETWVMPDGRRLGEWTGPQLKLQAMEERSLAHGHMKNATFFESLSLRCPGDKPVRKCVTDKEASALWRKAQET